MESPFSAKNLRRYFLISWYFVWAVVSISALFVVNIALVERCGIMAIIWCPLASIFMLTTALCNYRGLEVAIELE
jgi:hypothetical protein